MVDSKYLRCGVVGEKKKIIVGAGPRDIGLSTEDIFGSKPYIL